jgi:hypothetical protein
MVARRTVTPLRAQFHVPLVAWAATGGASDVVAFFGVANRFSIDLRAERDAFIADENATLRRARRAPSAHAPPFNEAPHIVLRLTAERTRQLLRRDGWGRQLRSEGIPIREAELLCDDLKALAMR